MTESVRGEVEGLVYSGDETGYTVCHLRVPGKHDLVTVKALQLAVSNGVEASHNSWDGSYFMTTRKAAERAYQEAGISNPHASWDEVTEQALKIKKQGLSE